MSTTPDTSGIHQRFEGVAIPEVHPGPPHRETYIKVYVGGTLQGTYPMAVGGIQNVPFTNLAGGPVVISSDNGAKIIASLYELKRAGTTGLYTGQNQMVGLPQSQLSDTYVLTRYNSTLTDLLPYVVFGLP